MTITVVSGQVFSAGLVSGQEMVVHTGGGTAPEVSPLSPEL